MALAEPVNGGVGSRTTWKRPSGSRAAADAGATTALTDFARHRVEAGSPEWSGFERYGLEADGSVAAPW
ncbi:hypothetical protein [Streptomyces tauricus]|uniref:hypothetical protein n=1 Tax=Streptomyces tauricus TaxID=68274 RepID=UPI0022435326|nr:hypothetical protein [Streptomyces tauricus]MCW8096756.1 hypothetical protein [Streptomyces tauricus]